MAGNIWKWTAMSSLYVLTLYVIANHVKFIPTNDNIIPISPTPASPVKQPEKQAKPSAR